jgi:hypothetical protein
MSNATDLAFLKELKVRLQDGRERKDSTQIDYALKMIDDWIDELNNNKEK